MLHTRMPIDCPQVFPTTHFFLPYVISILSSFFFAELCILSLIEDVAYLPTPHVTHMDARSLAAYPRYSDSPVDQMKTSFPGSRRPICTGPLGTPPLSHLECLTIHV